MSNFDLFVDTVRGEFVGGRDNSSIVNMPLLVSGDTLLLRIRLLAQTANWPNSSPPYDFIPTSGLTIAVYLGILGEDNYLTQQVTWTPSVDPADPYFEALLPLNTSEIYDELGSSAQVTALLQIQKIAGGIPATVLLKEVRLRQGIANPDLPVVPAGLTPLSAEAANISFLGRLILCSRSNPVVFQNETTGKATAVYTDDDGTW